MNFLKNIFKKKAPEHEILNTQGMIDLVLFKDYAKAIEEFQGALRLKPDYADAHIYLGQAYMAIKEYTLAATSLEKGLALDPQNQNTHLNLSEAYLALRRFDGFYRECEKILSLAEQKTDLISGFADNTTAAETDQEKFLVAAQCLAFIYYVLNRWEDLLNTCQGLLEIDPQIGFLHYLLGVAYFHKDRIDEAQAELRRAAELGSEEALKHPVLGGCDLCGAPLQAGTKHYTAEIFRKAVMAGLRPPETMIEIGIALGGSQSSVENAWVEKAMADDSDWLICADCAANGANYLS